MDTIGYVSLEYANTYVSTHFLSTDSLREAWEKLTDEDKKAALMRSYSALELLYFIGRKSDVNQTSAFPRFPSTNVPEAVMQAQVENAVSMLDPSVKENASTYDVLWRYGVSSYSIGNLSEKSSNGSWGHSGTTASSELTSTKALDLLRPYVSGGYSI